MGTPRHKSRATLKDSLSSLVPKEGTERALSQALDSEKETDKRCTFVPLSEAESKRDLKNGVHRAIHPNCIVDACNSQVV